MNQPIMTYEEQLEALATLIEDIHVRRSPRVKGPYASSDYVTWKLNQIFTPACWSFTILSGPELVRLNDTAAYVQVTGRLTVTFANSATVTRDETGAWPLVATKNGGTLDNTAPERYETALKAAVSDTLKACAERLGVCFRPLIDQEFHEYLRREQYRRSCPPSPPQSAQSAIADLYGDDEQLGGGDKAKEKARANAEARDQFYVLSSQAIRDGHVESPAVNELIKNANSHGDWTIALQALHDLINGN